MKIDFDTVVNNFLFQGKQERGIMVKVQVYLLIFSLLMSVFINAAESSTLHSKQEFSQKLQALLKIVDPQGGKEVIIKINPATNSITRIIAAYKDSRCAVLFEIKDLKVVSSQTVGLKTPPQVLMVKQKNYCIK